MADQENTEQEIQLEKELEVLCKDIGSQYIQCPNCKTLHSVSFNPYYKEGLHTCPKCSFTTAAWQFNVLLARVI